MTTSQIFDVAGPRQRKRIHIVTAVSLIALTGVGALVVQKLHFETQLLSSRWQVFYDWGFIRYMLDGFVVTIKVCLVSVLSSALFGVLLALGRISEQALIRVPTVAIIEFFRGIPFLLILFAIMFGFPSIGITIGPYWQLVVAITFSAGSLFAEVFRAGIRAIGRGQTEAGLANGLKYRTIFVSIILPQAVRNTAPALLSQTVRVIKESSLGYLVGVGELLHHARVVGEFTGNFIQAFLAAGLLYVMVNTAVSGAGSIAAKRLGTRAV